LEAPDLFLRFRDLELDPNSLLKFADRYGWIGEAGRADYGTRGWMRAVGISQWQEEIQAMVVAHHLWECLKNEEWRTLRKYFVWHRDVFDVRAGIRIVGREIQPERNPEIIDEWTAPTMAWHEWLVKPEQVAQLKAIGWRRDDVVGPARLMLMNLINPRLEVLCHPRLTWI